MHQILGDLERHLAGEVHGRIGQAGWTMVVMCIKPFTRWLYVKPFVSLWRGDRIQQRFVSQIRHIQKDGSKGKGHVPKYTEEGGSP